MSNRRPKQGVIFRHGIDVLHPHIIRLLRKPVTRSHIMAVLFKKRQLLIRFTVSLLSARNYRRRQQQHDPASKCQLFIPSRTSRRDMLGWAPYVRVPRRAETCPFCVDRKPTIIIQSGIYLSQRPSFDTYISRTAADGVRTTRTPPLICHRVVHGLG